MINSLINILHHICTYHTHSGQKPLHFWARTARKAENPAGMSPEPPGRVRRPWLLREGAEGCGMKWPLRLSLTTFIQPPGEPWQDAELAEGQEALEELPGRAGAGNRSVGTETEAGTGAGKGIGTGIEQG